MFQRRIGVAEVRAIIERGEVIEDRSYDLPYASRLLLVHRRILRVQPAPPWLCAGIGRRADVRTHRAEGRFADETVMAHATFNDRTDVVTRPSSTA